jgi:hypothetical protein
MRALRTTWIDTQRAREARPATTGADALERIVDRIGDPGRLALDVRVAYDAMRDLYQAPPGGCGGRRPRHVLP